MSSLTFYEKYRFAHYLSYATIVSYLDSLGANLCKFRCKHIFGGFFGNKNVCLSPKPLSSLFFLLPKSTQKMPAWYLKLYSLYKSYRADPAGTYKKISIAIFSKHWPSGPMLSISQNVHMFVCLFVCVSVRLSVHF